MRPALLLLLALAAPAAAEPWTAYRANAQRTGNADNQAGPASPKVLWVVPTKEHFIASPVPAGDRVLFSGLGAFNVSALASYPVSPKGPPTPAWSKSVPYLKLPTVSAPASAGDYLIFGDGMHQTSGATLYCVRADTGSPVWQLAVPGNSSTSKARRRWSATACTSAAARPASCASSGTKPPSTARCWNSPRSPNCKTHVGRN